MNCCEATTSTFHGFINKKKFIDNKYEIPQ